MKRIFWIGCVCILWQCLGTSDDSSRYNKTWTDSDKLYLVDNLDASYLLVCEEVEGLLESEWNKRPDSDSWSIAMIVEHLITHDELFSRELRVLTALPVPPPLPDSLFADDLSILSYREITPQNVGTSPDYLEPHGRWCTKGDALAGYKRVRYSMINFLKNYDHDLRAYYTKSGRGATEYRDLHQLLLISTAHTIRHSTQIRKVKECIKSVHAKG